MFALEINDKNLIECKNINPELLAQGLKDKAEDTSSAKISFNEPILASSAKNDQAFLFEERMKKNPTNSNLIYQKCDSAFSLEKNDKNLLDSGEIKNPEIATQGLDLKDSNRRYTPEQDDPSLAPYLLSEQAFSYGGATMSDNSLGYFRIPRSISRHPTVVSAPVAYRIVLYTILDFMAFKTTVVDDHGKLITLHPGQFMISDRALAKLAGVSRNDVQRALVRFSDVKILSQEVIHRKMVITITESECCDLIKNLSEPRSEPKVSQSRAIKEEYKNIRIYKEKDKKEKNEPIDTSVASLPVCVSFSSSNEKIENINLFQPDQHNIIYTQRPSQITEKPKDKKSSSKKESDVKENKIFYREKVSLTPAEYETLCKKNSKEFVEEMLDALESYKCSSGNEYKSDYHTMTKGGWVYKKIQKEKKENPEVKLKKWDVENIKKHFKDGETYSGRKCYINSSGITFCSGGQSTPVGVKFESKFLNFEFENILKTLGIVA